MTTNNWPARAEQLDITIRNFISGKYCNISADEASEPSEITKLSPRDGKPLYCLQAGSFADVNQAVASAKTAFESGEWRTKTASGRRAILNQLAELVENNRETFALYESLDVGKPITQALRGDVSGAAFLLRRHGEAGTRLLSPSGVDGSGFSFQLRKPAGVVAGIVGWNFPLLLAAGKLGPALAAGNCLVLKPSEYTSLSASLLAELAIEAGVPPGVFNVVHGAGNTVGDALARHQDVNLLTFVGSSATGKRLMVAAGESNMKRLILECGGKSPYLVFDDCHDDLDVLAADIVGTAFPNQGAYCSSSTRLLVHRKIKDKLLPKIIEQTARIQPGDPLDPETTFGALINEAHLNKVMDYIRSGKEEGAELLCGGERVRQDSGGYFLTPAIFDGVKPTQKIAREEIFGPVLSVMSFDTEEEAVALANNTRYGLAAYAATCDLARGHRLTQQLDAGHVTIKSSPGCPSGSVSIGAEAQKESGFGFEGGMDGLLAYTVNTTADIYL